MKVEVLDKGLSGFTGETWLLKRGGHYYVASNADVPFSGPETLTETLIFRSDSDGKVSKWLEVCGGKRMSLDAAVRKLEGMSQAEIDDA